MPFRDMYCSTIENKNKKSGYDCYSGQCLTHRFINTWVFLAQGSRRTYARASRGPSRPHRAEGSIGRTEKQSPNNKNKENTVQKKLWSLTTSGRAPARATSGRAVTFCLSGADRRSSTTSEGPGDGHARHALKTLVL